MADNDPDVHKDVPPWLQPVPETEEAKGFFPLGRSTLIAAGVAVSLIIVFVAAIMFLYKDAPKEGPRHIVAEDSPIREKPLEAGGMQVDHQDKAVLEIGDGTPATSRVQIGEQPEQPVAEIPDLPVDAPTVVDTATDTIGDLAEAALESDNSAAPAAEDSSPQTPVEPAPAEQKQSPAPATTPQPSASAGQYMVQLGAYGSEQSASTAWRGIRGKFLGDLGELEPAYIPVQSGDRTLYRLRVGVLETRAAADAVCISLRAQQQACFVVSP